MNRTNNYKTIAVCNQCNTPVSFDNVLTDYWAYCPTHDKDLFKDDCKVMVTQRA